MPDYVSHIILLPQGADWEWYKAIRNYLLHFRVNPSALRLYLV